MSTTVWVFDNLGKDIKDQDMKMLQASVKLWSIHCPQDKRVLYCSKLAGKAIKNLGIHKLFDQVISLSNLPEFQVNSQVFWAYPKLRVLSQVTEPVTLVDYDFMTFCNLREVVNSNLVCYNYTEDARQYYPGNLDSRIRALSYRTRWPEVSANVSFLQLPDPAFARFYAGTSLQIMEELTKLGAPNAKYLIFAEQMVLKHLLEDQKYQCLTKNIYTCREESFSSELDFHGIWLECECRSKFLHYGPVKHRWNLLESKEELESLEKKIKSYENSSGI